MRVLASLVAPGFSVGVRGFCEGGCSPVGGRVILISTSLHQSWRCERDKSMVLIHGGADDRGGASITVTGLGRSRVNMWNMSWE